MVHMTVAVAGRVIMVLLMNGMADSEALQHEHQREPGENGHSERHGWVGEDVVTATLIGRQRGGVEPLRNHDEERRREEKARRRTGEVGELAVGETVREQTRCESGAHGGNEHHDSDHDCGHQCRTLSTAGCDTSPMPDSRFHLAIPVADLATARHFYGTTLGFPEGRSSDHWVDFDMYGHQLVIHEMAGHSGGPAGTNPVDGDAVPVPHFGVLLSVARWGELAERLRAEGTDFIIEPHVRFVGEVGEQSTMFFLDPSGNALEFKAFADEAQVFASEVGQAGPG